VLRNADSNFYLIFLEDILSGRKNHFLTSEHYLRSNNSCFKLTLKENGNLVLFNQKDDSEMWTTKTVGSVCFKFKLKDI